MEAVRDFECLIERARKAGPKRIAVIMGDDEEALRALAAAQDLGIISSPLLFGPQADTIRLLDRLGIAGERVSLIDCDSPTAAASAAVGTAREGRIDLLMKGHINTADFMRAILDRQNGLDKTGVLTSLAAFDTPGVGRLLFLCDGGVIIAPDLIQKARILTLAIRAVQKLGLRVPCVAVLAAVETVNPEMAATIDAACLSKMADRGQIPDALVDGPLAFDNAISEDAARRKGVTSRVGGRADILLVPDIESGNILGKSLVYCAGAKMAGVVLGAQMPVLVPSRADTHESKLASIALGACIG